MNVQTIKLNNNKLVSMDTNNKFNIDKLANTLGNVGLKTIRNENATVSEPQIETEDYKVFCKCFKSQFKDIKLRSYSNRPNKMFCCPICKRKLSLMYDDHYYEDILTNRFFANHQFILFFIFVFMLVLSFIATIYIPSLRQIWFVPMFISTFIMLCLSRI